MIKATCVLLIARIVLPRLQARSAAERHLLWAVSLGSAAALSLFEYLLPAWRPEWASGVSALLPASFSDLPSWGTAPGSGIIVRATGLQPDDWIGSVLAAAWVTGMLVVFARLVLQFGRLRTMHGSAVPCGDPRLLRLLDGVAQAVGVRQHLRLLQTTSLSIPLTWGLRRPCVLLPTVAVTWSDDRLRAVLGHELAHVRRRDWLLHVLAEGVCAIYWFHPLFWLGKRHLQREAELAADDVALSLGMDRHDYAAHLVEIVRGSREQSLVPTVAMAHAGDLPARVASLLSTSTNRRVVADRHALCATALAACVSMPVGALAISGLASNIQVRAASLPRPLMEALSLAEDVAATAVRDVRVLASAQGDVVAPEVVEYTTPPLYSDEARLRGTEGVVVVSARVELDGRATQARVVAGLGYGLDQNALVALRQWRFRPATRDGVPTPTDVEVEILFSLQQERLNEAIANDMATQVGPDVTPPRAVITPQPLRVSAARGAVVLDVVLLEDGRPRVVRVLSSAGSVLDDAAVQTFEQWRFSPAMKNGTVVKVRLTAEVRFDG